MDENRIREVVEVILPERCTISWVDISRALFFEESPWREDLLRIGVDPDAYPTVSVRTKSGEQRFTRLLARLLRKFRSDLSDSEISKRVSEIKSNHFCPEVSTSVTVSNVTEDKMRVGEGELEYSPTCFSVNSQVNSFSKVSLANTPAWFVVFSENSFRCWARYLGNGEFLLCNFYIRGLTTLQVRELAREALARVLQGSSDFTVESLVGTPSDFYYNGDGEILILPSIPRHVLEELDRQSRLFCCPVCEVFTPFSDSWIQRDGTTVVRLCAGCELPRCSSSGAHVSWRVWRDRCDSPDGCVDCPHAAVGECAYCRSAILQGDDYIVDVHGDFYCYSCLDNCRVEYCEGCEAYYPDDEARYSPRMGRVLCDQCWNDAVSRGDIVLCENCGEEVEEMYEVLVDAGDGDVETLCEYCARRLRRRGDIEVCASCGAVAYRDVFEIVNGEVYCQQCAEEEGVENGEAV